MTASLKRDERLPIGLDQDLDRSAVGGAIFSALILAADWPSARIQNRLERSFQPFSRSRHSRTRDRIRTARITMAALTMSASLVKVALPTGGARARPPRAAPRSRSPPTSGRCVRCDFRFRDDRRSLARLARYRSLARSIDAPRVARLRPRPLTSPTPPNQTRKTRRLKTGARHLPRRARRGHGRLPLGNDDVLSMNKAAEYEVIHGRWAMLAIPGIVAQEQATGVPVVRDRRAVHARRACLENYSFPGAPAPLAPEGSGAPLLLGGAWRSRWSPWASRRRTAAADREPPEGVPGAERCTRAGASTRFGLSRRRATSRSSSCRS